MSIANEVGRTLVIAKNIEKIVTRIEQKLDTLLGDQVQVMVEPAPGAHPQATWGKLVSIGPLRTDEGTKP